MSTRGKIQAMLDDVDAIATDLEARSNALVEESRTLRRGAWTPYSIQLASCNSKLAPQRVEIAKSKRKRFVPIGPFVASTYSSISATCPDSCFFKDNGCFAQVGSHHLTMGRLDRASRGMDGLEVSLAEADGLSKLWPRGVPQDGHRGGRDIRLHVGGDTSCTRGARALADAVQTLKSRGLGAAWTYTHRWKTIPRESWGPIRIFASVERPIDAIAAMRRGYSPAMTRAEIGSSSTWKVSPDLAITPCPYEAHPAKPTCAKCRLCLDGVLDQPGHGVAFYAHGRETDLVKLRLRENS